MCAMSEEYHSLLSINTCHLHATPCLNLTINKMTVAVSIHGAEQKQVQP